MAHLKIQPAGQMTLDSGDRKPVVKVVGGDTWSVSVNLYNPIDPREPATPDNTVVEIRLAETQFDNPLWKGEWFTGIVPDETRKGLCRIVVPRAVTAALRRGSYMFSVRVMDILKSAVVTEAEGSFLVEYKTTSDQHSIPYKDGTSQGGQTPITPGADDVEKLEHELEDHVKNTTMHVTSEQKAEWSGKQDAIPDLQEIRDGAAEGASAYQTLEQGVPRANLASDVQTSLDKADTAIQEADLAAYVNDADYDSSSKRIQLKHGDAVVAYIDATAFIKDGMVSNVEIVGGDLVITFNTDAGLEPIEIPLTDIFDPDNYYDKTASDARFATKADATLTPRYTDEWIVNPVYPEGYTSYTGPTWDNSTRRWRISYHGDSGEPKLEEVVSGSSSALSISFLSGTTATRQSTEHTLFGYTLGSQSDKPLASEAEAEALRDGKLDKVSDKNGSKTAITIGSRKSSSIVGLYSVAVGSNCSATNNYSIAAGESVKASASYAHAEGKDSKATGYGSHAEGRATEARGEYSHAEGRSTIAGKLNSDENFSHAEGLFNKHTSKSGTLGYSISTIGCGTGVNDRRNAFEVLSTGEVFVKGVGGYDGTNPGAEGVKDLATSFNDAISGLSAKKADKTDLAPEFNTNVPVVKTPVYDGNNHYYANASDSAADIYQFENVGTHSWTMARKGILYLRLASASNNAATVGIYVNEADDGHQVLAMSMSNDVTVTPLFLNAGDVVLLEVANNPLSYVQYSAFYTD